MTVIKLKRSGTPSLIPNTTHIGIGELAINYADRKLYSANSSATFEIGVSTSLNFGNTTANLIANSILFQIANTSGIANLQPTQLVIGISVTNTIAHAVGANLIANSSALLIGNSTVNSVLNSSSLAIGPLHSTSFSYTSSNTNAQVLDSILKSTYRSAKYLITVKSNSVNAHQVSEYLVIHDDGNANAYGAEYVLVFTNSICATFTANANATHVRLYTTPVSANTLFRITRECHSI